MPRLRRISLDQWLCAVALAALLAVSLWGVARIGLVGPDEPRYASIGRAMALSGDWVTPRLWGAAWFEKPALLYWLIALGHRAGLHDETAARLPVALCGAGLVLFLWWTLRRLGRCEEAPLAALLVAASAGWMTVGNVAATDMPLAASFNGAVLATLLWLQLEQRRWAVAAGVFLGLALLAKGLVGAVLFLPLLWFGRRRWRGLVVILGVAGAVALPWYWAVTARNGFDFIRVFFIEHHFGRFTRPDLQHVQPFWFYVPVLLALLFPWTPLLALLRRATLEGRLERACAAVALFGLLFFSASTNKLPGYVLPLLPALCILLARGVTQAPALARWLLLASLALCAALAMLLPVVAAALPQALVTGLRGVDWHLMSWRPALADVLIVYVLVRLALRLRTVRMLPLVALVAAMTWLDIKVVALPAADHAASARELWRSAAPLREHLCVGDVRRAVRYGLNYYSVTPLPDCAAQAMPLHIEQAPHQAAEIVAGR